MSESDTNYRPSPVLVASLETTALLMKAPCLASPYLALLMKVFICFPVGFGTWNTRSRQRAFTCKKRLGLIYGKRKACS